MFPVTGARSNSTYRPLTASRVASDRLAFSILAEALVATVRPSGRDTVKPPPVQPVEVAASADGTASGARAETAAVVTRAAARVRVLRIGVRPFDEVCGRSWVATP